MIQILTDREFWTSDNLRFGDGGLDLTGRFSIRARSSSVTLYSMTAAGIFLQTISNGIHGMFNLSFNFSIWFCHGVGEVMDAFSSMDRSCIRRWSDVQLPLLFNPSVARWPEREGIEGTVTWTNIRTKISPDMGYSLLFARFDVCNTL